MRGCSGVTLSYVVRKSNELHPKPSIYDKVTAYNNHNEDMVKREHIIASGSPIVTEEYGPLYDSFIADRRKVWDLISPLIIKSEAWTKIKRARTSRDRRKATLEFHDHFMESKNINHIQKQAEQKLLYLSNQGERKKWTFKRFVTAHKEKQTII